MNNYELAMIFDEVRKSNLNKDIIDMIEIIFKVADEHKFKFEIKTR
jgi:hypothetical protein